jgi:hypothetical protein
MPHELHGRFETEEKAVRWAKQLRVAGMDVGVIYESGDAVALPWTVTIEGLPFARYRTEEEAKFSHGVTLPDSKVVYDPESGKSRPWWVVDSEKVSIGVRG